MLDDDQAYANVGLDASSIGLDDDADPNYYTYLYTVPVITTTTAVSELIVTYTNQYGCKAIDTVYVVGASQPNVAITASGCPEANLTLTATTGYQYEWQYTDGSPIEVGGNAVSTHEFVNFNKAPDTYQLEVTNSSGADCPIEIPFTITAPLSATASVIHVLCVNNPTNSLSTGSITVTPSGGNVAAIFNDPNAEQSYSYTWSHDATLNTNEATGLAAGDYAVTVTDADDCTTEVLNIAIKDENVYITENHTNVACFGESTGEINLTVTANPAVTAYTWSHDATLNANTATGLAAGTYIVTATNDVCSSMITTEILTENPVLTLTEEVTEISCNGANDASVTLTAIGGTIPYSYSYQHVSIRPTLCFD